MVFNEGSGDHRNRPMVLRHNSVPVTRHRNFSANQRPSLVLSLILVQEQQGKNLPCK